MTLHTLILAVMAAIHPDAPRTGHAQEVAHAIAYVVARDAVPDGWTREYTAAVLVVTAWEEGRFRPGVVGDNGRARCTMQVWGPPELARDPVRCVRSALAVMREGARQCPDSPLGPYCGSCKSDAARAIGARRLRAAQRLLAVAR